MRGQAFVAATVMAAALVGVQPASAQQYRTYHDAHVANYEQCQQSRNNRTAGGAIIGGVLGAVLGHNAAGSRSSRDEGTALGAVVGAVAGGAIGRNTARCDQVPQGGYDPYYGQSYSQSGYDEPYYDDQYGDDDAYYNDGYRGDCRVEQDVRYDRRGRRYVEEYRICRDRYGEWRRVD